MQSQQFLLLRNVNIRSMTNNVILFQVHTGTADLSTELYSSSNTSLTTGMGSKLLAFILRTHTLYTAVEQQVGDPILVDLY